MKIADYGKAITSYIESPTRLQKQQSKKAAENFLLITGDRIQLAEGSAPKAKPFTLDQFKEKMEFILGED